MNRKRVQHYHQPGRGPCNQYWGLKQPGDLHDTPGIRAHRHRTHQLTKPGFWCLETWRKWGRLGGMGGGGGGMSTCKTQWHTRAGRRRRAGHGSGARPYRSCRGSRPRSHGPRRRSSRSTSSERPAAPPPRFCRSHPYDTRPAANDAAGPSLAAPASGPAPPHGAPRALHDGPLRWGCALHRWTPTHGEAAPGALCCAGPCSDPPQPCSRGGTL